MPPHTPMNLNLKLVTISLFAWGFGEGMFLLFQPLYLKELGADPVLIGGILGAMGIALALAQIPSGYLGDRFGTRPLMWGSWLLASLAAWIMALANDLPIFTLGLLLYGLTGSVLAPMNAYITSARGNWSAEKALSVTSAAFHFGMVLGPLLGGFLGQQFSLKFLYMIAAIFFVVSSTLVLFIKKVEIEPTLDAEPSSAIIHNKTFMRILPLSFLALFFMFFAQPLTPVFLEEVHNLGLQQIGYLGAVGSIGNVVLALTIGQFKAKTGYLLSFPFVLLFAVFMVKFNHFVWFAAAYFFYGGYRLARTMLLAITRQFVKAKETGIAFGFMETTNGIATILAPPLSGLVYQSNPHLIFWIAIIGVLLSGIINIIFLPKSQTEVIA